MSLEASRLAGRGWEPGNCRDRSELHKAYEEHSQARLYSTVSAVFLRGGGGWCLLIGKYPKERTHRLSLGGSRAPSTRHKTPVSTSYRTEELLSARDERGSSAFHPQAHQHSLHVAGVHLLEGSSTDPDQVGGTLYSGCSGCGPLSHILSLMGRNEVQT